MFRVGAGEYERIDESQWSKLDMEIHEHPIIDGEIGEIRSKIDHRDFHSISHYIAKHNEYSSWEAQRFLRMSADAKKEPNFETTHQVPTIGVSIRRDSLFLRGIFFDGWFLGWYARLGICYFENGIFYSGVLQDSGIAT